MEELRVYTINFQYSDNGEITNVISSFSSPNIGGGYLNGSVELTAKEFSEGDTISQIKAKLIKELTKVEEPIVGLEDEPTILIPEIEDKPMPLIPETKEDALV